MTEKYKDAVPKLEKHAVLPEVLVIHHEEPAEVKCFDVEKEIVVDTDCAAAVLRGANIFAPGVIAMMSGNKCSL